MPKVSIIMPSLNVCEYIRDCLESVINQTLKDIEIICVDAGSTDGTLSIIDEYVVRGEGQIKLIVSEKKSYGYQMNLGMDAATGKYMGIVETDDFVLPDMFEQLYNLAEKYNVDFIKADHYQFITNPDGSIKKTHLKTCTKDEMYNKVFKPCDHPDVFSYYITTWDGIYSIDFLRRFNIRYNESQGASYQDNGFWFQTLCHAERVYLFNKPFYMYRNDNPNASVKNKEKVYCINDEYIFINEFLSKNSHLQKAYMPIYLYKKYRSYIYTYERIADKYKRGFIERFHLEFKEDYKAGRLDKNLFLFNKRERKILMQIINNPIKYYKWTQNSGFRYIIRYFFEKAMNTLRRIKRFLFTKNDLSKYK